MTASRKSDEHRACLPVREAGLEEVDDLVPVHVATRAAHQRWRDELTDGRDEDEEERGDDSRQAEWQRDAEKGLQPARVEVARRLEQAPVEALERDEDRQRDEGQPDVAEHQHDREAAVEEEGERVSLCPQPRPEEERVDHSLAAQDHLPGEDAQEVAREERYDQDEQEDVLPSRPAQGEVVGEGVGKGDDHRRDGQGHLDRLDEEWEVVAL